MPETATDCKTEKLAFSDKIEGRKFENSRARNQSVMQLCSSCSISSGGGGGGGSTVVVVV
jgi:hypothetical protein